MSCSHPYRCFCEGTGKVNGVECFCPGCSALFPDPAQGIVSLNDDEYGPNVIVNVDYVDPDDAARIVEADTESGDGRSRWMWFRCGDGTLIFGCFPQGNTYFGTEVKRKV